MNTIEQRLSALRDEMRREHLWAVIIPTGDPHQSEYTAPHWQCREWASGFNGSAGTAVVTMTGAALWTDSRYFIAARQQLEGTGYELMRLKMEGTPTIAEWIGKSVSAYSSQPSTEVAIDGMVASAAEVRRLTAELRREGGLTLRTNIDLPGRVWRNRPPIPMNPVMLHPIELAGETCTAKLARIRQALRSQHADGMLMARLDDIAWTLNLRGSDVHCTPVFVAYLLISTQSATLYIYNEKLTPQVEQYLRDNGIAVDDYDNIREGLRQYFEYNILIDPDEVCHTLLKSVSREVIEEPSPVPVMKTVKNAAEQAGLRQSMLRDGVAMVQFLRWFDNEDEKELTELTVCSQLETLRSRQQHYRGLSFDTIAAYGPHGAIVHYEPTPESDIAIEPKSLLLLDSGAQYDDGTTDITRTIACGSLTDEERRVYTLVLKGHLQLQNMVFPDGAAGTQLDAAARMPLWREGLNYLHGTGHGVGSYLCVHEGPHQIRMEWKPTPLRAGMTVTCEPGIYLEGRFGVRIENTLLIVPHGETECGRFLAFEPLTLCPIDKRPIIASMLSQQERQWLDDYHRTVYDRLSPLLDEAEREWLRQACEPLN